jgi:hypothetical protein
VSTKLSKQTFAKTDFVFKYAIKDEAIKGLVEGLIKLHEVNNSSTSGSFAFVHISPESKQNMVAKFTKSQHKSGFSKPVSLRNFACFTLIYTKYGYRISQLFYIIFFNGIFFNATILRLRLCFDLHRCTFDCENCGFSTQSMNKDYHIRKDMNILRIKPELKCRNHWSQLLKPDKQVLQAGSVGVNIKYEDRIYFSPCDSCGLCGCVE